MPRIKDQERPLSKRGRKEASEIGRFLKKSGIHVQAAYTSPAKRALDTACSIAKKIGLPRKEIKVVAALYRSNVFKAMKVIKGIHDGVDSAVIFGHNPEFLNLVNYLTTRPIEEFPTCGVFGIEFTIDSWSKAVRKKGTPVFFYFPKKDRHKSPTRA